MQGRWRWKSRRTGSAAREWTADAGGSSVLSDAVTHAANRADDRRALRNVDLAPQIADVDLDDVRIAVKTAAPHRLEDLTLGDRDAGVAQQILEQCELSRRQGHVAPVGDNVSAQRIKGDGSDHELLWPLSFVPAQECVDPGDQDRPFERFAQEVVGADLETLDLVHLALLGRQHQQRRMDSRVAQVKTDAETVSLGQHDVQDDDVVGAVTRREESRLTVVALVDVESVVHQLSLI